MSVFKKGRNKVNRRVLRLNLTAADSFQIPAGAFVSRIYAQNKSTSTAPNLTVGNAAAGAQYLASVAVPVAVAPTSDSQGYGILYPRAAIPLQPSVSKSTVYITLSSYPVDASGKGQVSVIVEYEEMWGSLNAQGYPVGY